MLEIISHNSTLENSGSRSSNFPYELFELLFQSMLLNMNHCFSSLVWLLSFPPSKSSSLLFTQFYSVFFPTPSHLFPPSPHVSFSVLHLSITQLYLINFPLPGLYITVAFTSTAVGKGILIFTLFFLVFLLFAHFHAICCPCLCSSIIFLCYLLSLIVICK